MLMTPFVFNVRGWVHAPRAGPPPSLELTVNGMGSVGRAGGHGPPLHQFYINPIVCRGVGVVGLVAHHCFFYIFFVI